MTMRAGRAAFTLAALWLAGCISNPLAPTPPGPIASTPIGVTSTLSPDVACASPQEQFNVIETVKTQLGAEAAARLQRLMTTDFQTADLKPEDRQVLTFVARETLWIPPIIEKLLGEALFRYEKDQLTPIGARLPKIQDFGNASLQKVLEISPKTPFDIEVMVLQSGTPRAMVGGRVFMDLPIVRDAMQDQPSGARREKLTFVYAHELAHIYKRHKAKRLQEQLLSISDAQRLARTLITSTSSSMVELKAVAEAAFGTKAIIEGLMTHQAEFLRSQEAEADACAAALMTQFHIGDPLRGFDTYVKERGQVKQDWTIYDEHPPDIERRAVIELVAKGTLKGKQVTEDVRTNLARHIKQASQRDPGFGDSPKPGTTR